MSCLVLRHHIRPPTALPPSTCNHRHHFALGAPSLSLFLSLSSPFSLFLFLLLSPLSRSRFPCDIVYSRAVNYTRSRIYVHILIYTSEDTINDERGNRRCGSTVHPKGITKL